MTCEPTSDAVSRCSGAESRTWGGGACLLLAEPTGHVKPRRFESELKMASQAGFDLVGQPSIRHCLTALLKKSS